ncbi:substrate-binding domain-containing protein [Mumia zhuanghuii]|uniref:VWA domain-containing protein n=1 Tax=Mumia zhuanghuii TaxID=2585211 RepID=A0A5C4MIX1_9ACTN|nr:substrate-binding domain-containing protein [Mumia zhuanghuii]TNC32422.1 VWA domain-containing protein [Mumia zhuanghuii]TNC44958.1 VWA domain-containing protein [Mumia zhuanghuii]
MRGRHAGEKDDADHRPLTYAIAFVVVVGLVVGVLTLRDGDESASADCVASDTVRVAVAPELAPLVEKAAERADAARCVSYEVVAEPPALTSQAVTLDDAAPHVWIPDSSVWLTRVAGQLLEGVDAPRTLVRSVATSPVVLAWPKSAGEPPKTWLQALTSPAFTIGDPLSTATATAPLLAAHAEAGTSLTPAAFDTVSSAQVTLAQRQSGSTATADPAALLVETAKTGGSTVVSEQVFNASPAADSFAPVLPGAGSFALGYPVALVSDDPLHERAAEALVESLTSPKGVASLEKAGFRRPSGEPLASGSAIGEFASMTIEDAEVVADTLRRWSLIALPAQALAVIDVSEPMGERAGGSTRMGLTTEAALTGLGLMPNSWALGTWVVARKIDGKKDWKELTPIRKLDTVSGGESHRDRVVGQIKTFRKRVGGRTSLYDTTLAAYRQVQAQYDPKAVNSVIILTGGRNDDPGSISRAKLVETLKRERDPARPVVVIAIGITEDADAFALEEIAKATGGQVYLARKPEEITDVFVNSLRSRH